MSKKKGDKNGINYNRIDKLTGLRPSTLRITEPLKRSDNNKEQDVKKTKVRKKKKHQSTTQSKKNRATVNPKKTKGIKITGDLGIEKEGINRKDKLNKINQGTQTQSKKNLRLDNQGKILSQNTQAKRDLDLEQEILNAQKSGRIPESLMNKLIEHPHYRYDPLGAGAQDFRFTKDLQNTHINSIDQKFKKENFRIAHKNDLRGKYNKENTELGDIVPYDQIEDILSKRHKTLEKKIGREKYTDLLKQHMERVILMEKWKPREMDDLSTNIENNVINSQRDVQNLKTQNIPGFNQDGKLKQDLEQQTQDIFTNQQKKQNLNVENNKILQQNKRDKNLEQENNRIFQQEKSQKELNQESQGIYNQNLNQYKNTRDQVRQETSQDIYNQRAENKIRNLESQNITNQKTKDKREFDIGKTGQILKQQQKEADLDIEQNEQIINQSAKTIKREKVNQEIFNKNKEQKNLTEQDFKGFTNPSQRPELKEQHYNALRQDKNNTTRVSGDLGEEKRFNRERESQNIINQNKKSTAKDYYRIGKKAFAEKKFDLAKENYKMAIKSQEGLKTRHYNIMAVDSIALKDAQLSERASRDMIKLDQYEASGHSNLADSLKRQKRYDEALKSIDKAVELNHNHPLYHVNRMRLNYKHGDLGVAQESFKIASKIVKDGQLDRVDISKHNKDYVIKALDRFRKKHLDKVKALHADNYQKKTFTGYWNNKGDDKIIQNQKIFNKDGGKGQITGKQETQDIVKKNDINIYGQDLRKGKNVVKKRQNRNITNNNSFTRSKKYGFFDLADKTIGKIVGNLAGLFSSKEKPKERIEIKEQIKNKRMINNQGNIAKRAESTAWSLFKDTIRKGVDNTNVMCYGEEVSKVKRQSKEIVKNVGNFKKDRGKNNKNLPNQKKNQDKGRGQ